MDPTGLDRDTASIVQYWLLMFIFLFNISLMYLSFKQRATIHWQLHQGFNLFIAK
jgi:hypothetical protein